MAFWKRTWIRLTFGVIAIPLGLLFAAGVIEDSAGSSDAIPVLSMVLGAIFVTIWVGTRFRTKSDPTQPDTAIGGLPTPGQVAVGAVVSGLGAFAGGILEVTAAVTNRFRLVRLAWRLAASLVSCWRLSSRGLRGSARWSCRLDPGRDISRRRIPLPAVGLEGRVVRSSRSRRAR